MDPLILRFLLGLYLIANLVLVVIIHRNLGSDSACTTILTMFSSLLIAFVATLPFLREEKWTSSIPIALFYDGPSKTFFTGNVQKTFGRGPHMLLVNLDKELRTAKIPNDQDGIALDIIERGVVLAISMKFGHFWKVEKDDEFLKFPTVNIGGNKIDVTEEKTIIETHELTKLLAHNRYKDNIASINFNPKLVLPFDSKIKFNQGLPSEGNYREIILFNEDIEIKLRIDLMGINKIHQSVPGVLELSEPSDVTGYYYKLSIENSLPFSRVYGPNTKLLRLWAKRLSAHLESLAWDSQKLAGEDI